MIRDSRWRTGLLWVIPLLAAALACVVPGQSSEVAPSPPADGGAGASPTPTVGGATEEATSGPALPTATAVYVGTAGEGDPLDLCALATPDEVQAVIGGPATSAVWFEAGQNCSLYLDETHFLIVQAGHDPDGKALHLGGLAGVRDRITDQAALQLLDQLNAQAGSLTLPALVEQALPVWRAAGFTAEIEPEVGDWAFWFYGDQAGLGKLAELGTGRASGAWVAVYTATSDEASAKALLKPLAAALLDRLPDNFTPTGIGY